MTDKPTYGELAEALAIYIQSYYYKDVHGYGEPLFFHGFQSDLEHSAHALERIGIIKKVSRKRSHLYRFKCPIKNCASKANHKQPHDIKYDDLINILHYLLYTYIPVSETGDIRWRERRGGFKGLSSLARLGYCQCTENDEYRWLPQHTDPTLKVSWSRW